MRTTPKPSLGESIVALLVILFLVFGARLIWALAVHHDWRCAFADCRIVTK